MMSADVEGSFAGFFPAAVVVPLVVGGGVLDALPSSVCALFFLRAIMDYSLRDCLSRYVGFATS
jgi:hypothetical protein